MIFFQSGRHKQIIKQIDIVLLREYYFRMKNIITLYHGSNKIIQTPQYAAGKRYNDYGRGFYCTQELDLAKEWAVSYDQDGYANEYRMNMEGLSVLDLSKNDFCILHWLAILVQNRLFDIQSDFG